MFPFTSIRKTSALSTIWYFVNNKYHTTYMRWGYCTYFFLLVCVSSAVSWSICLVIIVLFYIELNYTSSTRCYCTKKSIHTQNYPFPKYSDSCDVFGVCLLRYRSSQGTLRKLFYRYLTRELNNWMNACIVPKLQQNSLRIYSGWKHEYF